MKRTILYASACLALPALAQLPYQNRALPAQLRAEDLVKRLTLDEKIAMMHDVSTPVERLGIKPYNWWNEALHGVARAGLATVFPQPIAMAATFDPEAVFNVFTAVSDEARAKHAENSSQGNFGRYQGLTMWTPTVNILRDPRWGRGIETYGEDPYLTSRMGVEVVKGLQGTGENEYDKLHACAKHFAVHSGPEWNRHSFNAENIKLRDLYETYLPPFEALVKEGKVKEVMCAYNRFEGDPCCGSNRLLTQILRDDWNFDGIVVSDCGAIADFYRPIGHKTHPDAASASAAAVISGTDLDCGSSYKALKEGVGQGLIREADIDKSVIRLMKARFELGEMDPNEVVSWSKTPVSVICSAQHDSLATDMARKSMVLLTNKNNALPLKRGGLKIALVGPNANDSVMQWGNYNGTPKHTVTILEGIRQALSPDDTLIYEQGCDLVESTLFTSAFGDCSTEKGPGFEGRYWNNLKHEGEPVAMQTIGQPFKFCTSGATVFAPGVNLTDFSATYTTCFTPKRTGDVIFSFYSCGSSKIYVNGEEVKSFSNKHGSRKTTHQMQVNAGEKYDIRIDFEYYRSDAQLNFDLGFRSDINLAESVERVKEADVVIFAGGISPNLEGEEMGVNLPGFKKGDRTDIELPAVQREFIKALTDAGKRVIMVNCSGSSIGLEAETDRCEAILQAWYPGQSGGKAVADILFGDYNPSGRLPITFYKNTAQLPDFEDYDMTGRTYRYMTEKPLFPFGHGLSYTTFRYGTPRIAKKKVKAGDPVKIQIPITNTGLSDGDEIIQVYMQKENDADGPVKTLRAFKRIPVKAGKTVTAELSLEGKQFEWWHTPSNSMQIAPGRYILWIGGSSDIENRKKMMVTLN